MAFDYVHIARHPDTAQRDRRAARVLRAREEQKQKYASLKHVFFAACVLLMSFSLAIYILLRQSQWNGSSQRSFLIVQGKVGNTIRSLTVVTVRGKEKSVVILAIPDSMMIETLYNYGPYKASSLVGLSKLEKQPYTFLTRTLSFQLGIDVRDVIVVNAVVLGSPQSLRSLLVQTLFLRTESSLSYIDRYRLWAFLGTLRKDQVSTVDLLSSNVLKKSDSSISGEVVFHPDIVKFDTLVSQVFANTELQKEGTTVAVVNTTSESRLATRVARALGNMGVDVVNIAQQPSALDESKLYVRDKQARHSLVEDTVATLFQLSEKHIEISQQKTLEYRADVVVLLGKDAAYLFTRVLLPE
ncbi:MAG TPA: LytR C-terminal domain-containing protein [Patescibacteria group bacterium]|nr:LytR C-terminal domain-containing protein [Patescibacteria group bacterium]